MKTRELIELLNSIDPSGERLVIVDGYEDGYDNIEGMMGLEVCKVRHGLDEGCYESVSEIESDEYFYGDRIRSEPIRAVLLSRISMSKILSDKLAECEVEDEVVE